jgi:hypothetical protein
MVSAVRGFRQLAQFRCNCVRDDRSKSDSRADPALQLIHRGIDMGAVRVQIILRHASGSSRAALAARSCALRWPAPALDSVRWEQSIGSSRYRSLFAGAAGIPVCGRAIAPYAALALMERSPKMTASRASGLGSQSHQAGLRQTQAEPMTRPDGVSAPRSTPSHQASAATICSTPDQDQSDIIRPWSDFQPDGFI